MSNMQSDGWQDLYRFALLETDLNKLQERVRQAREAIQLRLQELANQPGNREERLAMEDALSNLRAISRS